MAATTKGFRYPTGPDVPDVPFWNQALASDADAHVPTIGEVLSTSNLTLSTTTPADVPGATVTFTTTRANAKVLLTCVADILVVTAAATTACVNFYVDGASQASSAKLQSNTVSNIRGTVANTQTATLAAAGSHTIKLMGFLTAAAGSFTVLGSGNTRFTYLVQES